MRMHIKKWSWLQYWWDGMRLQFFLPPNLQRFLCILIWLHCLVSLSFVCCWNRSRVFNLAPEVLTVLYQGQCSLWQPHRLLLALIDPNGLQKTTFSLVFFADESHWSVCKKSQILFGFGHESKAVQHSSRTFTCTFIRESNQVFLLTSNASFFYELSLKSLHLSCHMLEFRGGEEKQLLTAGCLTEPPLLHQH